MIVGQDVKVGGNLELESKILDFFNNSGVGVCKTDYRLSSFDVSGVGIGVLGDHLVCKQKELFG